MTRSGVAASAVVAVVVIMALLESSMAATYAVGETTGWQLDTLHNRNFYQDWERSHKPYFSTDSLEFTWIDPDSVLQVSFADFNACNTANPIQAWSGNPGGSLTNMLFPLRDYAFHTLYFISGFETNCVYGQKFYIDVFQ